jgi:hypothetical protein
MLDALAESVGGGGMRRTRHVPSGHVKNPVVEPTARGRVALLVGWSVGPAVSLVTARNEQVNQYLRPDCRHLLVQSSVVVAFPLRPGLLLGRPLSYRTVAKPLRESPFSHPPAARQKVDGARGFRSRFSSARRIGFFLWTRPLPRRLFPDRSPFPLPSWTPPVPTLTPASSSCRRA